MKGVPTHDLDGFRWIVTHTQITATQQVDVIGLVGIEHANDTGSLINGYAHQHVKAIELRPTHHLNRGIIKVGKLHQLV